MDSHGYQQRLPLNYWDGSTTQVLDTWQDYTWGSWDCSLCDGKIACFSGGIGLGGWATLSVNGSQVGRVQVPATAGYRISFDETFDVGQDKGTPVYDDYAVPLAFTDQLKQFTITLQAVPPGDQAKIGRAAAEGRIAKGMQD